MQLSQQGSKIRPVCIYPDFVKIQWCQLTQRFVRRWTELRDLANKKKGGLNLAHDVNTYHIECQETMQWIREKEKLIESTDELGNDLAGVMQLQRRLSTLERDLAAIQAKLDYLQGEADRLSDEKPEEAEAIRQRIVQITELWQELKTMLKVRDERLGEASELQHFLQNVDHFQQWLSKTQSTVAQEDFPNDLAEAERLLNEHQQVKEEIEAYAPDYSSMKDYGDKVVEGQEDVQYLFLRERLKALNEGWDDTHRMWDNKQSLLTQGLNLQVCAENLYILALIIWSPTICLTNSAVKQYLHCMILLISTN